MLVCHVAKFNSPFLTIACFCVVGLCVCICLPLLRGRVKRFRGDRALYRAVRIDYLAGAYSTAAAKRYATQPALLQATALNELVACFFVLFVVAASRRYQKQSKTLSHAPCTFASVLLLVCDGIIRVSFSLVFYNRSVICVTMFFFLLHFSLLQFFFFYIFSPFFSSLI